MRLCRFEHNQQVGLGFYEDTQVVSLVSATEAYNHATGKNLASPVSDNLLDYLPPDGPAAQSTAQVYEWVNGLDHDLPPGAVIDLREIRVLVPHPLPNKLFLLAGNYAAHIEEGNMTAVERSETFPWVFMKPPTTTLTDPGLPFQLPVVSPASIDYELELAVVMGRRAKGITEAEALDYVAGYTIVNDISDRVFRPNPNRRERERDSFFDWMHGKWHDGSCPCGPCIVSRDSVPDPQDLAMQLRVNGEIRQDASTAQQIFPVAAVIDFLSSFVTLEPGDMISTGTSAGVGHTQKTYLSKGDRIEATIERIGTLVTPVVEADRS